MPECGKWGLGESCSYGPLGSLPGLSPPNVPPSYRGASPFLTRRPQITPEDRVQGPRLLPPAGLYPLLVASSTGRAHLAWGPAGPLVAITGSLCVSGMMTSTRPSKPQEAGVL